MAKLRYGVDAELEAQADALIFAQTAKQKPAEKADVLTPYKERLRLSREVYANREIDPEIRRGMFRRARNTVQEHLNSRDCVTPARVQAAHLGADEQWEANR
jgi:hypothetical protein